MIGHISSLVVMGVAGCGKSSVAQALATRIGGVLIEGDAFHPKANVDKMQRGIPLTDEDRAGWLDRLSEELERVASRGERAVLACSALKQRYRNRLRTATSSLGFVFLDLSQTEALRRVAQRESHFMPASLVESQFAALERPDVEPLTLTIDGTRSLVSIVGEATAWCGSAQEESGLLLSA
ncbi:gluconokinase [Paraburkholderia steynii]|uniref:Gluconokinase n=1 Tax=Paraburkholderia steynii TaxID=1245441 RepID=A0A7Z7B268_9BURK|nr:gluconokinase [Paraburkholderia steynii]SDH26031.1 gluconokinase [Paraburkholderia steynii]